MKVWMLVVESVLVAVLWVACIALDIGSSFSIVHVYRYTYLVDAIILLVVLMLFHIIVNCWLLRIVARNRVTLLFLILQLPSFFLFRGAWHGLRACFVQGERHKKHRALKAKFTVCFEVKSSTEKLPAEELEHREASCISSHNGEVPEYTPTTPLTGGAPEVTSDTERGAETPIKMKTTKFVKGTNKIQMTPDDPVEIYSGEQSVYKYTIRCLQALFADKKRLSYHFVLDPTGTRILHVSCTDKRIGSLPDRIISENPRVICNDVHYILNLSRFNGYEVYDITKRSSDEVTTFVQRDLNTMIWLPVWPLAVIKIYHLMRSFLIDLPFSTAVVWWSLAVGLLTWLVTHRTLYQSVTDRLLVAGHRLSFYVVRTILLCSVAVLARHIFLIPIAYLSAKGAGALSFVVYIAFVKARRNVELFGGAFDRYTFYAMYDPAVQVGESLAYFAWAISYHATADAPNTVYVVLIAVIGQSIGMLWIWFARPRLRQPLLDPTRVLDMIKQMEDARQ